MNVQNERLWKKNIIQVDIDTTSIYVLKAFCKFCLNNSYTIIVIVHRVSSKSKYLDVAAFIST